MLLERDKIGRVDHRVDRQARRIARIGWPQEGQDQVRPFARPHTARV